MPSHQHYNSHVALKTAAGGFSAATLIWIWIMISIDIKCWIRIRIDAIADPPHWYLTIMYLTLLYHSILYFTVPYRTVLLGWVGKIWKNCWNQHKSTAIPIKNFVFKPIYLVKWICLWRLALWHRDPTILGLHLVRAGDPLHCTGHQSKDRYGVVPYKFGNPTVPYW